MKRLGAPQANQNAQKGGLYARQPGDWVPVAVGVRPEGLAVFARDLGDASLWLAEALAAIDTPDAARAAGLYASVAQELWQVAGEMEGATGIKASPLGTLSDEAFGRMMEKQVSALSLILSQCRTAWRRLRERHEIGAEGGLFDGEKLNPILGYLAAHMRSAKRMMRDLAANRAWHERGQDAQEDLAARILAAIQAESER